MKKKSLTSLPVPKNIGVSEDFNLVYASHISCFLLPGPNNEKNLIMLH